MYKLDKILKKLPKEVITRIDRERNLKHMLVLYSATSRGIEDSFTAHALKEKECSRLPIKVHRQNAKKYYGELAQKGYVEIIKTEKNTTEYRLTPKGRDAAEKAISDLNMGHLEDALKRFEDIAEKQEEKEIFIDLEALLLDAGIRPSRELLDIFKIKEGERHLPFRMVGDYVSLWEPREFKPWGKNDIVFDSAQFKDESVDETLLRVTQAYPNLKPHIHQWIRAVKLDEHEKDLPKFFIKEIVDESLDEGGKLHIKLDISRYIVNKALEMAYVQGPLKEIYKNKTLRFEKDIPNMVIVGLTLYTKDCNIILGLRSHHVAYYPKTWAGMYEQMNPVEDRDFFDTAIRGLYEEFSVDVDKECIKLLTIGREGINANVNVFGVADLQKYEVSEIFNQWMSCAPDGFKKEFDYLDWRPLENIKDLRSMLKILRSEKYEPRLSGRPIENFHPTTKMTILLLLLYKFGEDMVKETLLDILRETS